MRKNENEDVQNIIINILNKVLEEKSSNSRRKKKEIKGENAVKYTFISDDKYILDVGHSIAIKDNMSVSGIA